MNTMPSSNMKDEFLLNAHVITPNVPELEILSSMSISRAGEIIEAGELLSKKYDACIFVKGGHFSFNDKIDDYLIKNNKIEKFTSPNMDLTCVHGTGCLISSAITAFLAQNYDINIAIIKAKEYFYSIILNSNTNSETAINNFTVSKLSSLYRNILFVER